MTTRMTPEQLQRFDSIRVLSVEPTSFNESANTVEVVFSTGAVVRKRDWRNDTIYLENLPLSGMDLEELNNGAHVLRNHGMDSWNATLDAVLGSVVPGSAKVVGGEARATLRLSPTEGDAEVVAKIKAGVIRKISYGYEKVGDYVVSTDPGTGLEMRTWAKHRPYEISFVPVPADGLTNTRSAGADGTPQESTMDTTLAPGAGTPAPAPVIDLAAVRAAAGREEHDRLDGIRSTGKKLGSPEVVVEALCNDMAVTLDAARAKLIDAKAAKDAADATHNQHVDVVDHTDELRVKGLEEALLHRTDPRTFPLSDNGRRFRSLNLAGMARQFAGPKGNEMSDVEAVDHVIRGQRALLATSDFPTLLANVANKNFEAGQNRAARWFEPVAA